MEERKKAEEKIKKTAEEWKKTFDAISDFVFILDKNFRFVRANKALCNILKKEPTDLIGKRCFEVMHGTDKPWPNCPYKKTLATRKAVTEEVNDPNLGIPLLVSNSPIFDDKGELIGCVHIAKDITERKQMEETLGESEEKHRNLLENARDTVMALDLNGNITFVNRVIEEYGFKKDEIVGKSMAEFVSEKSLPRLIKEFAKVIRGNPAEGEIEIITPKGKIISEYRSSPIRRGNKVIGSQTILRDITERKKVEEALKESEEKFRNIFESATDSMAYLDMSGRILEVNEKAVEVFGGSKRELMGKHFTRLGVLSPRDIPTVMSAFAKVLAGKQPTLNLRIKNKKGQQIFLECSASLMKINGKVAATLIIARDITEREKAKERIGASEERYRSLVELAPDGIVTLDMKGVVTLCNTAATGMTGYSKDEIVGKHFSKLGFLRAEDIPKYLKLMSSAEKGKIPKSLEVNCIRKDGTPYSAEVRFGLLREGGETIGFQIIGSDITERKQIEEKLRESEEQFRNLFESIQDPVGVYVGREGRLVDHNEAFNKLSGYTDEELKDKTFLDFVHPDDHAMVLERYRTRYAEEELPLVYEIRALNKKGEVIPLEISVSPYRVKGKVIGVEAIGRDITERKQMEEKLRQYSEHLEELVQKRTEELLESEKRYSHLVEEASDGVAIVQDGKMVFTNKKGAEIVGYSRDELIGQPFEKLVDEKYSQFIKEVATGRLVGERVPETVEFEAITKNNKRVLVEAHGTLIHYQGRPALFAVLRDISERKRMEEERLKLEKLATIGELATMVGHDLRNPLQAIENAAYCLNNELPRLPPSTQIPQKALEMLQIINDSVNYADKIIRDLHDFSATKKPIFKKININTIVEESLSQVETPENVKLVTELGHLPKTKIDKDMIKRVFMNLAINGIQAMEKGGTLKVSTKKTRGMIEVSFKDTGIGMPKETIKKIFTPFFTTRAKGMGMGLPICKKFVEAHGGTIEVESEEGKGSTFTVKLSIQLENRGGKT